MNKKITLCLSRVGRYSLMGLVTYFLLIINPYLAVSSYGAEQLEEVELLVGDIKIFPAEGLKRVVIGDPGVADVSIISTRELMLMAKSAGVTRLIIWDKAGERPFTIRVFEDTGRIVRQIERLLEANGIEGVIIGVEGQKVFLVGEVMSPQDAERVKEIIAPFPKVVNLVKLKARQPLVQINVEVLEAKRDDLKELGIRWAGTAKGESLLTGKMDDITWTEREHDKKHHWLVDWGSKTDASFTLGFGAADFLAKLKFLAAEGKTRTLASPNLVTLSGEEASIVVGGEIPIPITTVTELRERIEVEWRTYGVVLEIKPTVMETGEIRTSIRAEISEIDEAHTVKGIPGMLTREATTELYLESGETIILAGLIKSSEAKNVNKLPFLSNVPILGKLFKSTKFSKEETELIISITPMVISSEATEVARGPSGWPEREIAKKEFRSFDPVEGPEEARLSYSRLIQERITRALSYPDLARENGWGGIVVVGLHLLSDGSLEGAIITRSSGITSLDQAALAGVEKEAPYPPFPPQMRLDRLSIEVPIIYEIRPSKSCQENLRGF